MRGASWWRGRAGLNDVSVGIELVNPGHEWGYRPFPERRWRRSSALAQAIMARWADARRGRSWRTATSPRTARRIRASCSTGSALARAGDRASGPSPGGELDAAGDARGERWQRSAIPLEGQGVSLRQSPRGLPAPLPAEPARRRARRGDPAAAGRCRRLASRPACDYLSRPVTGGRTAAPAGDAGEESPGSTGTRCRVTPGGGDPRESATESIPPAGAPAFGPGACGQG